MAVLAFKMVIEFTQNMRILIFDIILEREANKSKNLCVVLKGPGKYILQPMRSQ